MRQASESGMPPVRALFLAFPADDKVFEHADDQFMLGEALLVAPVVLQHAQSRKVNPEATVTLKPRQRPKTHSSWRCKMRRCAG